jgi:hypothetical protein
LAVAVGVVVAVGVGVVVAVVVGVGVVVVVVVAVGGVVVVAVAVVVVVAVRFQKMSKNKKSSETMITVSRALFDKLAACKLPGDSWELTLRRLAGYGRENYERDLRAMNREILAGRVKR